MDPAKLWYTVSFIVFIGLMYRPIQKSVVPALDRYRDSVAHRMKEARSLREEAQKLVAQYSEELRDMEQTYADMLKKAHDDVLAMRTQMLRQHEQDKKSLQTAQNLHKTQSVRRMELDFERYLLTFLLDSLTLLVEKSPSLSASYQALCLKNLPKTLTPA
jgi:F0F1-type ATP synthase membrane subunit b/b'